MMSSPAASFRAQAAGHDHPAVFGQRLADGVERLLHGGVDEAAGVDDHQIGAIIRLGRLVAFGTQLGEDLFEPTSALGQPSETKPTFGAAPVTEVLAAAGLVIRESGCDCMIGCLGLLNAP